MGAKDLGQVMLLSALVATHVLRFGIVPRRRCGPSGQGGRRLLALSYVVGASGAGLLLYALCARA
jgi:hypothetical protein